jgi:putative endonuclease
VKIYYVYTLLSADRSFYAGITNDVECRLAQHEGGYEEAIAWEKQLKAWSRAKKVAFVSGNFNLVHELAKRTQK